MAEINEVTRTSVLECALKIGRVIFERIFAADAGAWQQHGGRHPSFKQLARHPNLPFGPKKLWECVGIYRQMQENPELAGSTYLGVAHRRAVLGLPSPDQYELLTDAERQRLTSKQLEAAAADCRRRGRPRPRGRPPSSATLKKTRQAERLVATIAREHESSVHAHIPPAETEEVRLLLHRMRDWLRRIEAGLVPGPVRSKGPAKKG